MAGRGALTSVNAKAAGFSVNTYPTLSPKSAFVHKKKNKTKKVLGIYFSDTSTWEAFMKGRLRRLSGQVRYVAHAIG